MSATRFQDVAQQVATLIGVNLPRLEPDSNGVLSFTLRVLEVDVTLTHVPDDQRDEVFVLVFFGPVPPDREALALRELLNANLLMLRQGSPSFSCNPLTGDVVLQYVWPLAAADGALLVGAVETLSAAALAWRNGYFLPAVEAVAEGYMWGLA